MSIEPTNRNKSVFLLLKRQMIDHLENAKREKGLTSFLFLPFSEKNPIVLDSAI